MGDMRKRAEAKADKGKLRSAEWSAGVKSRNGRLYTSDGADELRSG